MTQPPDNNWCIGQEGKIFSDGLCLNDLEEMLTFDYHN